MKKAFVAALVALAFAAAAAEQAPDARLADGSVYYGTLKDGLLDGRGRVVWPNGAAYEGEVERGRIKGTGRYQTPTGDIYEGEFDDAQLVGRGRFTGKNGWVYEGDFREWRPHGEGTLTLPNGDVYKGGFANGSYNGPGTLTYAKPQPDGRTQLTGIWRFGYLRDEAQERQAYVNVETALYRQRALLDQALAAVLPSDPSAINLYLLAIGGDGAQEVFRREVEFVRDQFDSQLRTKGRSVVLVNSRNSVGTAPMATITSIRETLQTLAARMDRERDILFVFLTSHGSEQHELTLAQNNMRLRGLPVKELAAMLEETQIRWKVVVVSACFSGGFVEPLRSDTTLVMTAARHDRSSFGCSDDNDFTYFGRAYFKESLPASTSFVDAFRRAELLIRKWEDALPLRDGTAAETIYSFPQIAAPKPVADYLARWWSQLPR